MEVPYKKQRLDYSYLSSKNAFRFESACHVPHVFPPFSFALRHRKVMRLINNKYNLYIYELNSKSYMVA
jgi:hypothetical protein